MTCPHCGSTLEPKPFPLLQAGLSGLVALGLVILLARSWSTLSGGVQQAAMFINPPTATATYTPTATFTPTFTPSPTATPTETVTPTATPTFTPPPTLTPSATPTNTPIGAPTATTTPTPTATPTPRFGKPVLLGPDENKVYGRDEELILRWANLGALQENESYAVRMTWTQNGQIAFGGANVKDNFWVVPPDQYWGLADEFTGRKYEWVVFVEEIIVDDSGRKLSRPISDVSDRSTFLWQ